MEYRSYDSAGVALLKDGNINVYKKEGKVSNLEEAVEGKDISASRGIGHTDGLLTDPLMIKMHILTFLKVETWL